MRQEAERKKKVMDNCHLTALYANMVVTKYK